MRLLITVMLLIPAALYAGSGIGRIVQSDGYMKKTNINCTGEDCSKSTKTINPGERILTAKNSKVDIMLNDHTALTIYEKSDVIFNRIRTTERDKPTEIFIERGKVKIIQSNSFMDTALIVKTPVAIVKSVCSRFSIVSGTEETVIFVYSGETGFAGLTPSKDRAFILSDGDESSVLKGESPKQPVKVERILRSSWLGRHIVSEDSIRVLRYNKESGPAEWPFIKND